MLCLTKETMYAKFLENQNLIHLSKFKVERLTSVKSYWLHFANSSLNKSFLSIQKSRTLTAEADFSIVAGTFCVYGPSTSQF